MHHQIYTHLFLCQTRIRLLTSLVGPRLLRLVLLHQHRPSYYYLDTAFPARHFCRRASSFSLLFRLLPVCPFYLYPHKALSISITTQATQSIISPAVHLHGFLARCPCLPCIRRRHYNTSWVALLPQPVLFSTSPSEASPTIKPFPTLEVRTGQQLVYLIQTPVHQSEGGTQPWFTAADHRQVVITAEQRRDV